MSHHYNKLWNNFVRWFDRAFSRGWMKQVLFLGTVLLFVVLVWTVILAVMLHGEISSGHLLRITELVLDPGAFVGSDTYDGGDGKPYFPVVIQFIIAISGAVLFTSMIITVLGNILSNRIEEYKKGRVRYHFSDHILILGASSMLVNMLREFIRTGLHGGRKIVVLTSSDIEKVHDSVISAIPELESKLDVTLLSGSRVVEETLACVQVDDAYSIYILGEDNEVDHDDISLMSWKLVRKLCKNITHNIDCHLVVNRVSTYHVMQFGEQMTDEHLNLNIVNSLENWAQRVIVSREYQIGSDGHMELYPAIDREGISKTSEKTVRLVIFGMTQMGYAMATTAAHVAHFPNYLLNSSLKTKICFVASGIKQEMDFFTGHYANLFQLSHAEYKSWGSDGQMKTSEISSPDPQYGDFLDVEWEFIDSSVENGNTRRLLEGWAKNANEYLTIAICGNEPDANMAASLYLPDIIYEKKIPVFVYQPLGSEVLKYAHSGTERYRNIYPFGMPDECHDPLFRDRLVKAKRINYLYELQNTGRRFVAMCDEEELDEYWNSQRKYVYHSSNIYAANSIPFKLRAVGVDYSKHRFIEQDDERTLAEIEHNRWNMERLLMGFRAMPFETRREINDMLSDMSSPERRDEGKRRKKEYQNKLFIHKDIAPYNELPEDSRQYDFAIVHNLLEVMR